MNFKHEKKTNTKAHHSQIAQNQWIKEKMWKLPDETKTGMFCTKGKGQTDNNFLSGNKAGKKAVEWRR